MDARERTSFFEEQERARRRTWRSSLVCAIAAGVMGAPLAVFFTPLAFLAAGMVLKLVPGSASALSSLVELGRFIPAAIASAVDSDDAASLLRGDVVLAVALLLAPGMAILLGMWVLLERRFRRSGVGGLLLTLSARPPASSDLEEIQLVNLVEEMAIAASIPLPGVLLIDDGSPNAAAVGSGPERSAVLVSRGLLARLPRDETQAVAAHLVGSIGSGDLRILGAWNAVFQCAGLVLVLLDTVFHLSPSAARSLARVARFALGAGEDPREAAEVEKLLVLSSSEARKDGIDQLVETRIVKRFPFLQVFLLPFLLASVAALFLKWQTWLIRAVLVGPMVMLVWRNRRYHADAVAVRLTRNPDAVARSLSSLELGPELVKRAPWCEPLFVVGAASGGWSDQIGGSVASHPPLHRRLRRIAAMGGVDLSRPPQRWRALDLGFAGLLLLVASALVAPLMAVVIGLSFVLAAFPALLITLGELAIVIAILA